MPFTWLDQIERIASALDVDSWNYLHPELSNVVEFYIFRDNIIYETNRNEKGISKDSVLYKCQKQYTCQSKVTDQAIAIHRVLSMNDLSRELSLVAMKYVPPTSVQLTLFDQ